MTNNKIIIIGTSLSGKTTLKLRLEKETDYNIREIDQELTELNDGEFPMDEGLKKKLSEKVKGSVIASEDIIFFTNADYFTIEELGRAIQNGFEIIIMDIELSELLKRNTKRVKVEGYQDMSEWLPGMKSYIENLKSSDLDYNLIDASQPPDKVYDRLLSIIRKG